MLRDVVAIEIRDEIKRKKELNSFYATVFLSAVIHFVILLIFTILILPGQYKHEELFEVSVVESTIGGGGGGSETALDVKPLKQPAEEEVPLPKVPIVKAAPVPEKAPVVAQNAPRLPQQNYPRSGYGGGGHGTGYGPGTGSGRGPGSGSGSGGGSGSGFGPGKGPGSRYNTCLVKDSRVLEPEGIPVPEWIGGTFRPKIIPGDELIEGEVTLALYVDKEGKIYNAEILKASPHPDVDEALRTAYLSTSFKPSVNGEKPTEVKLLFVIQYTYKKI